MKLVNLRTEYLKNPLAIVCVRPRFSFDVELDENEKGVYQKSLRIIVSTNEDNVKKGVGDFYDSGEEVCAHNTQIYYNGPALKEKQKYFWRVKITTTNGADSGWSEIASFRAGIRNWQAKFIRYEEKLDKEKGELASPVRLGKTFKVDKKVRCAYLYATALGLYLPNFNGRDVEETVLAPEWTCYYYRSQYQVIDVTKYVKQGENDVYFTLANGWYSGVWQFWPPRSYAYGTHPELLAQIEIEYENGEKLTVCTDDSWRASLRHPVLSAGIYEGENIDGRVESEDVKDYSLPVAERGEFPVKVTAQINPPISVLRTIKAKSITKLDGGALVCDFGENVAGRINFKLKGEKDTTVKIFHNEMLCPNGSVYKDNLIAGHMVKDVDRQVVRYTFKGNENGEYIRPRFTYMGFRYVEITGLSVMPNLEDLTVEVLCSTMEQTGYFRCSNQEINSLQENILRSSRSNFMGVPTDCPQRDERCGYTGDMQFFLPTALNNFDMSAFVSKWLIDLCEDSQLPDGSYPDHAPRFGEWSHNVGWGEAGVICPYLLSEEYGDLENVKRHFDSMQRFAKYNITTANLDNTRGPEVCGNGDWLHTGGGASKEVLATAYYALTANLMAKMSRAIGKTKEYEFYKHLHEDVKKAFAKKFILQDGSIKGGGVTGYALAFTIDLLPNDKGVVDGAKQAFVKAVKECNGKINTGFIGTPRLLIALHNIDRDDLAEKYLMRRECPSWLYPVSVGATTVWERFDSWTEENGFADSSMNSFNHYAFGSVGDYFYSGILGVKISPETKIEGYEKYNTVIIKPAFLKSLDFAEGERRVLGSKLFVKWWRENGKIKLKVKVGANVVVKLIVGEKEKIITCGEEVLTFNE